MALLLVCIYVWGLPPTTAAAYPAEQWILECQDSNPRLDRLASAIQRGDIEHVRSSLDNDANANELWRGGPGQICFSPLLTSVWYGQEEIFRLLLKRGADPLRLPRESLQVPVRDGRLGIVRTLLALGLKPHDNDDIVLAGLQSKNVAMLELLLSSGASIDGPNVPLHYFTNDLTRFLVPRYLSPNDRVYVGIDTGEPCAEHDGCEGTIGPLWLHFVATGNHAMVEYMIKRGADLTLTTEPGYGGTFTAMKVAAKRKDKRMSDLLRRSGAR